MMRDPVSVILSGFNYDSTDPYDRSDRWLGSVMKVAQNLNVYLTIITSQ